MNDVSKEPEAIKPPEIGVSQEEAGVKALENLVKTLDKTPPGKQIEALEKTFK